MSPSDELSRERLPVVLPQTWRFRALRGVASLTRRLPVALGERLAQLACDRRDERLLFDVVIEHARGFLVHASNRNLVEWEAFFLGEHERSISLLLEHIVPSGGVAVDAGAHVGHHSLLMARLAGPAGRVLAFEPSPRNLPRLQANLAINRARNIRVRAEALDATTGTRELFLAPSSVIDAGTASLSQGGARAGVTVRCRTLDEVMEEEGLARLDALKIDVEGHELDVLRGARKTLETCRPVVVFEYADEHWNRSGHTLHDARELFRSLDYLPLLVIGNGWLAPLAQGHATLGNLAAFPRELLAGSPGPGSPA